MIFKTERVADYNEDDGLLIRANSKDEAILFIQQFYVDKLVYDPDMSQIMNEFITNLEEIPETQMGILFTSFKSD